MNVDQVLDLARQLLEGKILLALEIEEDHEDSFRIRITDSLLNLKSFRGLVDLAEKYKLDLRLDNSHFFLETEKP